MTPEDINPYGWTAVVVKPTRIVLLDDGNTTVVARNVTPLKNLIPIITSNKRPWKLEFSDSTQRETKEVQEYDNKDDALQALQDHLKENPVDT